MARHEVAIGFWIYQIEYAKSLYAMRVRMVEMRASFLNIWGRICKMNLDLLAFLENRRVAILITKRSLYLNFTGSRSLERFQKSISQ